MNNNNDKNNLFNMFGVESNEETPQEVPKVETQEPINIEEEKPQVELNNKPVIEITEKKISSEEEDKKLLREYIGSNYEKIVNGGFSFCTFLFGVYYLYYRKQYKKVLPLLIFQIITLSGTIIFSSYGLFISIISLLVYIYLGLTFKSNYVEEAMTKINEVKKENLSPEETKEKIRKLGGVDYKAFILLFLIPTITTSISLMLLKVVIDINKSDFEIHFPEAFKEMKTPTSNSYKLNNYKYEEIVANYRKNENVCNYKVVANTEYTTKEINKTKEEIAKKYLKDKHNMTAKLEGVSAGDNNYLYYYDEKEKTDYYIYITDKSFTEISVIYVKDSNKKCHELTKYILEHSKKVK